jgi:FAD/FMN-containing dehydrogenase
MTASRTQALIEELRGAVGAAHVLTEGDLAAWEQDWRKQWRGKALAVVRPCRTSEVASVVKACVRAGVSLVPQGGNTGLVRGSIPDESGTQVVLSLTRMNAVREIDADNLTLTVEAGAVLQNVQEAAEKAGYLFPLSLAAQGSCTIGGNLSTNAGGTQVVRYGNARELCLGLEVVTPQGEVWNGLSGLRKDNTGYDLRDLLIGAEGTLGVITAATMKLYPLPTSSLTAWAAVPSMEEAVHLLRIAHQQLGAGLTGFEVMGQFSLELTARHFPQVKIPFFEHSEYCVLLENAGHESAQHARAQFERLLESAIEEGCVTDAVVAENIAQAKHLWQIRENIPIAQAMDGVNIKHDISLPISAIPRFCAETDALLAREIPQMRLVNFGHLGDGNLHYNIQAPAGVEPQAFLREWDERVHTMVYDAVRRFGGSISAEHGVGSIKLHELEAHKDPAALAMMRAIKRALDPANTMNPGRVVRT